MSWPKGKPNQHTASPLGDAIDYIHTKNPEFCSKEIALMLDKSWGSVRWAAQRRGIVLKSGFERRIVVPWLKSAKVRD